MGIFTQRNLLRSMLALAGVWGYVVGVKRRILFCFKEIRHLSIIRKFHEISTDLASHSFPTLKIAIAGVSIFLLLLTNQNLFAQNAIVGTGFTGGWTSTANFEYLAASAGTSFIKTDVANGTGNQYFRMGVDFDGTIGQYTIISGSDILVNTNSEIQLNSTSTGSGAMYLNVLDVAHNYVFKTKDAGASPSFKLIIFKVEGTVRSVSTVSKDHATVYRSQTVTVTATLDNSFSTGQSVYLRYTTDNFTTSTVVEMTGSGTIYTAQIPSTTNLANATVKYYVFTSGNGLTITGDKADWYTINLNNSGSNYTYTVNPSYITKADGNWATPATWEGDQVPPSGQAVTINHVVTLNQDANVSSLTINAAKSLVSESGQARTLTITSGGTLTNNGTFTANDGKVSFAGSGTVGGTIGFNNVDISGSVNFGLNSTVNGTLKILAGGYVNTDAPTYATGSLLQYSINGSFNRDVEWSKTSGSAYPCNVQISNNTVLYINNAGINQVRQIAGNLTIDQGSTFDMQNLTNVTADIGVTVLGNIVNNGTVNLSTTTERLKCTNYTNGAVTNTTATTTLSSNSGGDLELTGNLTDYGVFTPNQRAVFFTGTSGNQTITAPSGETFDYVIVDKAAGDIVLANNITINQTLTLTKGNIVIGTHYLTFGPAAAVAGTPSATNMIVADGTGTVRKVFTGNGSFNFPIGDATGTAEYSPVSLNFSSGTFSNAYAAVRVTDAKHPNNSSATNYLTRYWTVASSGITAFSCTVIDTFPAADVNGSTASMVTGKWNVSLPWVKYGSVTAATNTATDVTSFGDFTGITAAIPTVTISADPGFTVCQNTTLTLTANPDGDPDFTYLWSTGATTPSISFVTASVGTNTYSVTVTDANGFSSIPASASVEVKAPTVATATSNSLPVCVGGTITLFGLPNNMASYSWTGPNGFVSSASSPTIPVQDFNTLASTGTSSSLPTDWYLFETGTNANNTYSAGTGTDNTGDTYSFGSSLSIERAFGMLRVSKLKPVIGAKYTNNTGSVISSISISYTGEQWRLGASGRADRLDFQYSTNATSLSTGTWNDANALDFTAPVTTGAARSLDGNATANRTLISYTINGLSIANSTDFWIRFNDFDATGADDGLAIDDFNITYGAGSSQNPIIPNATTNMSGTYYLTITDLNACTSTANTNVTVNTNPTATIGGNNPVCVGATLNLSSSGGATYSWTGPDSFTSTSQNPSINSMTTAKAGNYTVTVTNAAGCTATATVNVVVNTLPTIIAGSDSPKCVGSTINFTSTSGSATSYSWSGPNSFNSTSQNPAITNITTAASGSYYVTVTDANNCSNTSSAVNVVVNPLPPATASSSPVCVGGTIQLTGGPDGMASYAWTGPNGYSSLAINTIPQDFNSLTSGTWSDNGTLAGWYSQRTGSGTSYAIDNGSLSTGNLYNYGTISSADRALGTIGSGNASVGNFAHGVRFQNTSGQNVTDIKVSYTLEQWRNSAAAEQSLTLWYQISASAITLLTPNNNSGWTQVTGLTLSSPITGGTAGNLDGNLVANRKTVTNVSLPSVSLPNNQYIMIKWEDPDHTGTDHGLAIDDILITYATGGLQSPTIPSAALLMAGVYTLTVTDANGCSNTATTNVVVNPLPTATITAGGPTTFCQGGSVALTASAGANYVYVWSTGATTQVITATTTGSYTVTVTNSNSCSAVSAATVVTVNTSPTATITPSGLTTFCQGGSVSLTASGGTGYVWSNTATSAAITVSSSGSYTVTITHGNGCSAVSSATVVTVNSLPTAAITPSGPTTFCQGGSVVLTASGGTGYVWSNTATTAAITAISAGSYTVTVTDGNGCTNTASTTVTVNTPPTATATSYSPICAGDTIHLFGGPNGMSFYNWSGPNGYTSSAPFQFSQNFDGLVSAGSWFDNITLPGWYARTTATATISGYGLNYGNTSASGLYSFGSITSTERGLGYAPYPGFTGIVGTGKGYMGWRIENNTGVTVPNMRVSWTGEQWRRDDVNPETIKLYYQIGPSVSNLITGVWSDANSVFTSPFSGSTATLVGTEPANREENILALISAPLPPGQEIMLRWEDLLDGDKNHFMAIDDVVVTFAYGGVQNPSIPNATTLMSGVYTLTVTDAYGCSSTDTTTVIVNPLPIAVITPSNPPIICPGTAVELTASGGTTYVWNTGAIITTVSALSTGTYIVTVTDGNGCKDTESASVTVADTTKPTFTPPAAQSFCVENITAATYSAVTGNLASRPEYYLFKPGDNRFDLDPSTFGDNCSLVCAIGIRWLISFDDGTFWPLSGYNTGQPSTTATNIQLPGSATGDRTHSITYWIVDCNTNVSLPQTTTFTIEQRPNIIKN